MQAEALGNTVALAAPGPIQVVLLQLGKDIQNVLLQHPTTPGVARLLVSSFIDILFAAICKQLFSSVKDSSIITL